MQRFLAKPLALLSLSCLVLAHLSLIQADPPALQTLQTYCSDCHSADGAEGGVRTDIFAADAKLEQHVEMVEKIIRVLKEQQMPPADAEQPSATERVQLLEWIETRLQNFDCGEVSRPGRVTLRRLNRAEYDNTIRDLTGLDLHLAEDFPSDDVGNGFDNIGDVLSLPPILLEKYLESAEQVALQVMQDPSALKRVFPVEPADASDQAAVIATARENTLAFARRAFRRPLTIDETERLFGLMRTTWDAGATKEEILQTVITAVLASPHFLYRVEDDHDTQVVDGIRPLNDFELASRLSYFLWSSMPDERLFDLAGRGALHTPEQLAAEAERMLADPKSQALVQNFAGQWLQLRDLDLLSPDPQQFTSFDASLRQSMRRETELLFEHIIAENRSLLDLLDADYTFVDQRLAEHYGLDGIEGDAFRKIDWQGQRRGVLMHASILLITSNPTRTSPVKRGKWVLDNLLGESPPPPPPDVPVLAESGETLGTLRQQMEQHRANPNCAVCHTKMDALGFGLENFDAIGRWREADGRNVIDPSGTLPGGRDFKGPVELVQILSENKRDEFSRCVSMKMLTYALGRGLSVSDRCAVNTIVEALREHDFKFDILVKSIVTSSPFRFQETGR